MRAFMGHRRASVMTVPTGPSPSCPPSKPKFKLLMPSCTCFLLCR